MTSRTPACAGGTPVRSDYLVFGQPTISEEEIQEVADVLRSGWIGMGSRTLEFERMFADYVGAEHAVAVGSCTAALHLSLLGLDIGPGDEVITSSLTFAATVNAILATGARPVVVDVDRETMNIGPDRVRAALTPCTKAVMPVHFGGLPCDLAGLREVAEERGLHIVEDAAHAIGAVYEGQRIGGHGNPTCFSFYPNKNITTGEGGMITTADAGLAERLRVLRLHGLSSDAWKRYESRDLIVSVVTEMGFKYNMTDIQAALGVGQLGRLETFLEHRERIAAVYDERFTDLPIDRQTRSTADRHGLHLYVILLRLEELTASRNEIVRALRAENIGVAMHYAPIHAHPFYEEELDVSGGDYPNAEWISERTVTLPMGPSMDDGDVQDVVTAVRSVLQHFSSPHR